jgi:hypothetical protein
MTGDRQLTDEERAKREEEELIANIQAHSEEYETGVAFQDTLERFLSIYDPHLDEASRRELTAYLTMFAEGLFKFHHTHPELVEESQKELLAWAEAHQKS